MHRLRNLPYLLHDRGRFEGSRARRKAYAAGSPRFRALCLRVESSDGIGSGVVPHSQG
jgi:hypothetical protein